QSDNLRRTVFTVVDAVVGVVLRRVRVTDVNDSATVTKADSGCGMQSCNHLRSVRGISRRYLEDRASSTDIKIVFERIVVRCVHENASQTLDLFGQRIGLPV